MDWVDKRQNYKDFYGILRLLRSSRLKNLSLKTLRLSWVAFHSVTIQFKCLDFQSNQFKIQSNQFKNSFHSSHVSATGYKVFLVHQCSFLAVDSFLNRNFMLSFFILFPFIDESVEEETRSNRSIRISKEKTKKKTKIRKVMSWNF